MTKAGLERLAFTIIAIAAFTIAAIGLALVVGAILLIAGIST